MLKPLRLQKVRLIGLLAAQADALELWQSLGVMHLTTLNAGELGLTGGRPIEAYDAISEQLVRMRAIKNALKPVEMGPAQVVAGALAQAAQIHIEDELLAARAQGEKLDKRLGEMEAQKGALERLAGLDVDFSALPIALEYHLFSVAGEKLQESKSLWSNQSWHAEWLTADDPNKKGAVICLVAVPKGVDGAKALAGTEKLEMPTVAGTPRKALLQLQSERLTLDAARKGVQRRMEELSQKYYPLCTRLEESLSIAAEMAQGSSKFGRSQACFYAEGWIKPEHEEMLNERTEKELGGRVSVLTVDAHEHHGEGMPTVLKNPAIASPFEFLLEFMGRPKSDELDPTMILFVAIPIIYGMIVGDAGYALVSFFLAWLITLKVDKKGMMGQFARLWMIGAIPSFVFGVAFDEYFGFGHQALLGLPAPLYHPWLSRVNNTSELLFWTLMIGSVMMALGFVLGAVNAWEHSKKHAYAKLAWLPVQLGGSLMVAVYMMNALTPLMGMIGVVLFVAGAAALAYYEGPIGLVEIPGLSSNIMSFTRIAIVGIVGLTFADVINEMFKPNMAGVSLANPVSLVPFVVIGIIYCMAHIANTGLAMLESFIHGARLNVVEFFGKFYSGGGIAFQPFSARREFTKPKADEKMSRVL